MWIVECGPCTRAACETAFRRRFVRKPSELRNQLGQCNALISSGIALQFFERVTWKESDPGVFIERGTDTEAFSSYLIQGEDYALISKDAHRERKETYSDFLIKEANFLYLQMSLSIRKNNYNR